VGACSNFWGPKAELRRFPDGAIAESVAWERAPGEEHLIVSDLLAHALLRHARIAATGSLFLFFYLSSYLRDILQTLL
jgi:U3 small nucleolar RNA-associated protein 22